MKKQRKKPKKLSEALYGNIGALKNQTISQNILDQTSQGNTVYQIDTEHGVGVYYEPDKNGNILISVDPTTQLKRLAIDPGAPTGVSWGPRQHIKLVDPYNKADTKLTQRWYLNMPRGFGKNAALMDRKAALEKLSDASNKAGEGIRKLQEANEFLARRTYEATCLAEEAVTDEKVKAFAETNYLPYDYAREILIQAHIDYELTKDQVHDEPTQPSTEADSVPDDHS